MPVLYQKLIFRSDLRHNPKVLYLFGDNEQRSGFGGQAKEMRGEPNAIGVRTKRAPGLSDSDLWIEAFDPASSTEFKNMIDEDLECAIKRVTNGGIVIIPSDGLGTGLSHLPNVAPKTFRHLLDRMHQLEYISDGFASKPNSPEGSHQ